MKFISISAKILILIALFHYSDIYGQYTSEWKTTIGGSASDFIYDITTTPEGIMLIAGVSHSSDNGIVGYHSGQDGWLTKMTNAGEVIWSRCYGSNEDDGFNAVFCIDEENYLVAGYSSDASGDVSENNGSRDVWILKLNSAGDIIWQFSFGDGSVERANKIISSGDGNYFIICTTTASGPDHILYDFQDEALIIKINSEGEILLQKTYGGSSFDEINSATINAAHELVMAGYAMSDDGDVIGHTYFGNEDAWFLKTDSVGNILNSVCYGELMGESYHDILNAPDSGYIILSTGLNEGATCIPGQYDVQLCKTNGEGIIEWQQCYGDVGYDWGLRLAKDLDGYFIAGNSLSPALPGFHGFYEYDMYVVKVNGTGDLIWEYCYGGNELENNGVDIESDNMGGFILAGSSNSTDGDNTTPFGPMDGIVIKVTCDGVSDIFAEGETEICTADSVRLTTPFITGASWKWFKNEEEIPMATDTALMCYSEGNYYVEVLSPTNCIKRSETIIITDTCFGAYYKEIPYGIYPNPAANGFTLECIDETTCSKIYDIAIYNMNGKLVKEIINQNADSPNHLNMYLKQGFYYIIVSESEGKKYQLPLVITY